MISSECRALIAARELEVPLARGLLVPLSSHEQTALQQVASGISEPNDLRATSLARLKMLALVEESEGLIRLTALGTQRWRDGTTPSPDGRN